jgi:hypothetical protein
VLDAAWGGRNIVCIERFVAAIMRTAAIYIYLIKIGTGTEGMTD